MIVLDDYSIEQVDEMKRSGEVWKFNKHKRNFTLNEVDIRYKR